MFIKSVLISILMVLYLSNICDAIQCYVCQSETDPACGIENFQPKDSFKRNCDRENRPADRLNAETPTKCSLFVEQTGNIKRTYRQCLWKNKDEKADCYKSNFQNAAECKSCDSDLCNSAPKIFSTIGATIFVCLIGLFLH